MIWSVVIMRKKGDRKTQRQELINESDDSNMAGAHFSSPLLSSPLLLFFPLNPYFLLPFLTYHLSSCLSILLFSPFFLDVFYLPFHLKPFTNFSISLPLFSLSSFVPASPHFLSYKWIIPHLPHHSPSLPYPLPSTVLSLLLCPLPSPPPPLYPPLYSILYLPLPPLYCLYRLLTGDKSSFTF